MSNPVLPAVASPANGGEGVPAFPVHLRAYAELARIVREHKLIRRARWFYLLVAVALCLAFGGVVTGFILLGETWYQLLMAGALGVLLTQVAFVAHEAAHRQIFRGRMANIHLARIIGNGIVGMSYSWWHGKHTGHHTSPNQIGKDPDIGPGVIAFVPADAARASGLAGAIVRRQGWLFFPLLTLEGLNLHWQGLRHVLSHRGAKGRWTEIGLLAGRFALILTPIFVLLPLGMAFAFLGVQLAVFGVYMGASFAPNHKGMAVFASDSNIDFFSKQVRSSRNIRGGWWMTALMGGLNHQIEHHLFPGMPRPFLSRARSLVRAHCDDLGVPYVETGLFRSYGIVVAHLNRVGLAARDPWECPLMAGRLRG